MFHDAAADMFRIFVDSLLGFAPRASSTKPLVLRFFWRFMREVTSATNFAWHGVADSMQRVVRLQILSQRLAGNGLFHGFPFSFCLPLHAALPSGKAPKGGEQADRRNSPPKMVCVTRFLGARSSRRNPGGRARVCFSPFVSFSLRPRVENKSFHDAAANMIRRFFLNLALVAPRAG